MLRRVLPAANAILIGHMIPKLGSVILVPLFLRHWTATLYGEYLALFAAVSYLSSLDVGVQQASVNRLTQAYAKEDLDQYRIVQHTTTAFYLGLATTVTILVGILAWFLPLSGWIGLKLTAPSTARIVIALLALYVIWSLPFRLISATYQSTGNLARTQWIGNLQQIFVVLLTAIALFLHRGMISIAFLQVVIVGVIATYVLFDLRKRLPMLFPGIRKAQFSAMKELTHPSLLFALLLVGNLIAFQGSTLIVSAVMGGLAVAVLSISRAMIDLIRQVLYSVTLALCPDFARMEILGELDQLRKIHRLMMAATATITLALAASVWYEGGQIITVWTRGRIEPDTILLRLFLILLVLQTPWAASSTIGTATNRHSAQAIGYFFAASIGVGLITVLVRIFGTWAVPIGLIIGEGMCCYHFVIQATCRTIGERYGTFALRFWLGFGAVTVAALSTGWIVHSVVAPILVRWIAMGLLTLSAAAACGWIVWLTPADRASLSALLRAVFNSFSAGFSPKASIPKPSSIPEELLQ